MCRWERTCSNTAGWVASQSMSNNQPAHECLKIRPFCKNWLLFNIKCIILALDADQYIITDCVKIHVMTENTCLPNANIHLIHFLNIFKYLKPDERTWCHKMPIFTLFQPQRTTQQGKQDWSGSIQALNQPIRRQGRCGVMATLCWIIPCSEWCNGFTSGGLQEMQLTSIHLQSSKILFWDSPTCRHRSTEG